MSSARRRGRSTAMIEVRTHQPTNAPTSTSRFEYPHSWSYQPSTFTIGPFAIVSTAEKTHDAGLPTMSADTSCSSEYSRMPRYDGSAAALAKASLTSSLVAGFARYAERSVIEPVG